MKLYSFYTDSHQVLKDEWFIPSLQDDFELIIQKHEQECHSGDFMSDGWIASMIRKVDLILTAIEENEGEIFIHADIDIQFFQSFQKTLEKLMVGRDFVVQRDSPAGVLCAGFFAARANEKNHRVWTDVRKELELGLSWSAESLAAYPEKFNDQTLLNERLRTKTAWWQKLLGRKPQTNSFYKIDWEYLPDVFFSGGTLTGVIWNPGDVLPVPDDVILHHANWTVGVENKITQLKYVRDIVESR